MIVIFKAGEAGTVGPIDLASQYLENPRLAGQINIPSAGPVYNSTVTDSQSNSLLKERRLERVPFPLIIANSLLNISKLKFL